MTIFKNFVFLSFILFSTNSFAKQITLVWGDTLSKLIFKYQDRNLNTWKELLPLYLSLNPQIVNPDLIYTGKTLTIPNDQEVADYLISKNNWALGSFVKRQLATENFKYSLIDRVSNPWSIEFSYGPYLKYFAKRKNNEYTANSGFTIYSKTTYYLNDKYSLGVSGQYDQKKYSSPEKNLRIFDFSFISVYLEGKINWDKFIFSALLGVKDRLSYDSQPSLPSLQKARHIDYGLGFNYRLIQRSNLEALVGLSTILFSSSNSLKNEINQDGLDIKASFSVNYNLWKNHLINLESIYSLTSGKNAGYQINLEELVTRLGLQINF